MKGTSLAFLSLLLSAPACGFASEQLIPAGSLIQCTVSEPKLSSKTSAIGDPVLCQLGHSERYGRSVLPYDSYLVGRFEDYKDPGHFVGKGWMELRFDRMVIEPDTIVPVDARVVAVPGYNVDRDGRILGKGHAVRDVVMWSIPILWPVDLLMLPMRGPRPTLKEETRLTLKVMDDLAIPSTAPPEQDPSGLMHRPVADNEQPPQYDQPPQPQVAQNDPPPMDAAPPAQEYSAPPAPQYAAPQAPVYAYAPPPPVYVAPPPPVYAYAAPPPVYAYGGGGYGGGGYGGGGGAYAYGRSSGNNGYRTAPPRTYRPPVSRSPGYNGPPRAYAYGGAQRSYGPGRSYGGYAGQARGAQAFHSGGLAGGSRSGMGHSYR